MNVKPDVQTGRIGPVGIATLRVFLDSLEEGVVFLDAAHRILEVNCAAERLLGTERAGLVERPFPNLFRDTKCTHRCEQRGCFALILLRGARQEVHDLGLPRADGSALALRIWGLPLPPNEDGLHCAIILRECSNEVALEEHEGERWQLGGLIGSSPKMRALYDETLRAAASDAPVLITGESGVGKELVARALHDYSRRANSPYVPLHCASLPENLLESELFGHARGAFSGAGHTRIGRFEAASGGTLLLDEIGEISPAMQTKLLRVLQEREIVRLGENHARKVDVRVIAATHRDLGDMVRRGAFREDLYYRLRVLPLLVPALRERRGDIPILTRMFVGKLAERYARPALCVAAGALTALQRFHWPGNVRQLFNALEFAVVHAEGGELLPRHLPPEILAGSRQTPQGAKSPGPTHYYRTSISAENELDQIRRVLAECGGNRAEAARRLGMSRTTLWKRLK